MLKVFPCQSGLKICCSQFPTLREMLTGTISYTPLFFPYHLNNLARDVWKVIISLQGPELPYVPETTGENFKTVCETVTVQMIYRKMGMICNNGSK